MPLLVFAFQPYSQEYYANRIEESTIMTFIKLKSKRRTRWVEQNNLCERRRKFLIELKIHFLSQKSPQSEHFLREGRLLTPGSDSLCGGLNLKVGKLYLIAGNSKHISICNFVKEYSQMTIVERRGFAGGYKKGCACEVSFDAPDIHYPMPCGIFLVEIELNILS